MSGGLGFGYFPPRTQYGSAVCALPGCGREFKLRTWDHKYCCTEHEKQANNARHSARDKARRKQRRAA